MPCREICLLLPYGRGYLKLGRRKDAGISTADPSTLALASYPASALRVSTVEQSRHSAKPSRVKLARNTSSLDISALRST
jgi:hypothetical protein